MQLVVHVTLSLTIVIVVFVVVCWVLLFFYYIQLFMLLFFYYICGCFAAAFVCAHITFNINAEINGTEFVIRRNTKLQLSK